MINRKGWYYPDMDHFFAKHAKQYPETKFEQNTINVAYQYVKKFDNVIDVGANIGLHSVRFCQKFKNVFSFEPVQTNFECLIENTKIFDNIKLYNIGLGDKKETAGISIRHEEDNCGAYSLVDYNHEENIITEKISIEKLDNFDLDADLIKVDIQGYEGKFLLGATETIKRCKPIIVLEVELKKPFRYLNSILTPLGYRCVESVRKDKIWISE